MRSLISLAFLIAAACGVPGAERNGEAGETQREAAVPPAEPPADVARGQAEFGVALYRHLASQPGNIFVSPASISTALAMVHAGAEGETAAEMASALRYPEGDLPAAMGALLDRLPVDAEGRILTLANALWVQEGFPLQPDYLELVRRHYDGAVEAVDYEHSPDAAVARINQWAEEKTAGRIKGLLTRDNISADTRLILTNSIYFKADWLKPFSANSTGTRPFLLPGGKSIEAVFMRQRGSFRMIDEQGFNALEAPYKGGEFSMILLVPDSPEGLKTFEAGLKADKLEAVIDALMKAQPGDTEFVMPKLELTTKASLVPALKALGMRRAFTNGAQLGGIAPAPLRVSDVIHQTFLLVDEKGTEAAAVTAPIIEIVSMPRQFHADRPFFFLIRDNRTGATPFMGRIEKPVA